MTVKEILENCDVLGLKLKLKAGAITITGEREFIEDARFELEHSKELTAGIIELLRKQTAQVQAQGQAEVQALKPGGQSQPEPHVYTYEEVTANYHKAYLESKRRLALDVNTPPFSPFFVDGVTDKLPGYKWTAELAKLRERQAIQAKEI